MSANVALSSGTACHRECEEDRRFLASAAQDDAQYGRTDCVDFGRACGHAVGEMCKIVIDRLTRRSKSEQVLRSGGLDMHIEWLVGK